MEHLVEYLKVQAGILIPALVGVMITILTSEKHSFLSALTRVASGLFCAMFLTEPILTWMEWDAQTYQSAVSGLLAINGFQIVKFVSNLTPETLLALLHRQKGKK